MGVNKKTMNKNKKVIKSQSKVLDKKTGAIYNLIP